MKDYKGMAWHVHHSNRLVEFCWSINERLDFIKKHKPEKERSIRERLLKPVVGELPAELVMAWEAYDKAWEAYGKAREAYSKAREAYSKAREAYDKAREAYDKVWEAYDKAWEAYDKAYKKHLPAIEALHAQECPDCPWDGNTIFPEGV